MAAFIIVAFLLATTQAAIDNVAGPAGGIAKFFDTVLHFAYVIVIFFAFPQAFLLLKLGVTNFWARVFAGAISGWMYLFASFIDAQLIFHAATKGTVSAVGVAFWSIVIGMPHQVVDFALSESRADLVLFAVLGAAFGAFVWAPMYRLSGKRDWDNPILGGRPPYAR